MVGAKVEVKNLLTNVVTTVQTNNAGSYNVPPINPGQYSVTVSAAGFKTTVRNRMELRVADRKELDVQLEVGGTTETVVVSAEAPLLDTATGSMSTTINRQLVASVPTYAQNVFQLVRYTAGVSGGVTSRSFDNVDNGARILGGSESEVLLNGSPNTFREFGEPNNTISPPPDAVGEVKIIMNLYDAEYGRTGGGVISISLKSGSNNYHGAVGWLARNPIFNANTFTGNATGAPNTSFKMNQGIFELDGPFRIPGLYDGRNKTFFTYAVNVYRNRRPVGNTMVVPTALQRAGDFSETYVSGTRGATVAIYDPLTTVQNGNTFTRLPFANGIIPPSKINPLAAKVAEFYLAPNQIAARGLPNLGIFPSYDREPFNTHTSRWDHVLSPKESVLVTISRDLRGQSFGGRPGLPAYQARGIEYASNSFKHWRGNVQASLNLTSTISPTLINAARVGFNRHEVGFFNYSTFYDPTQLGFPASLASQIQTKSFPNFAVSGYDFLGGAGGNVLNYSSNITAGETLTKILGKHALKFGGEARQLYNNQQNIPNAFILSTSAAFTQANPLQAAATSGDGLASFLLGYPSSVTSTFDNSPAQGQRYYSAFVQNDWKATRRLTLNLGVRWEYESPITDRYDRFVSGFDASTVTTVGSVPFIGGLRFADSNSRRPYKRDLNNWAPRLGFAYQAIEKLVVRGGWSISYSPTATVAPTTGFSITTSPSTSVANAGILPITAPGCTGAACGLLSNPFSAGINRPLGRSAGLLTNAGNSVSFVSPSRTIPYTYGFSASVQYELPFRSVLEVSYNGRRSRELPTSYLRNSVTRAQYLANGASLTGTTTPNPYAGLLPGTSLNGANRTLQQSLLPYPQFIGVTETDMPLGTSRYDAVIFNLEKRFSSGLSFVFNGTFVKSKTYATYLNNGIDAPGEFIKRDAGLRPYTINLFGVYTLPFFKNGNAVTKTVLGGWQISGYSQWLAGPILGVSGANSTGIDPSLPKDVRTFQRWFNTCTINNNNGLRQNCASATEPVAWVIQRPFTLITQPDPQWSKFRGRAIPEVTISLFKIFKIREYLSFELRADANNATNTPMFANPNTTATSSLFGVTTLAQNFAASSTGPRQIQVGARFFF